MIIDCGKSCIVANMVAKVRIEREDKRRKESGWELCIFTLGPHYSETVYSSDDYADVYNVYQALMGKLSAPTEGIIKISELAGGL